VNSKSLVRAVRFAAVCAASLAAHQVGDYYMQNAEQGEHKGDDSPRGQRACAGHVATYTLTQVAVLVIVSRILGLNLGWRAIAAGQLISASTHYFADRAWTLEKFHDAIGKGKLHRLGMPGTPFTGGKLLDQAWHHFWLFVAALATAVLAER
jgi:hypothetical protein